MDEDIGTFLGKLVEATQDSLGENLAAVYLVGSLAMADALPPSSDVDVLVAVEEPLANGAQFADMIVAHGLTCPWAGIEYVVYRAATLAAPVYPMPYELNVNAGPDLELQVSTGGDPSHWFLLDVAMAQQHAIALVGPPAEDLIAEPAADLVATAILDALDWHAASVRASPNAVLNACRSWRWLATGRWVSKSDAGRWALDQPGDAEVVRAALERRRQGKQAGLDERRVARFLSSVAGQAERKRRYSTVASRGRPSRS